MTIKVDRVPAAEHLLILLDKNSGKKETGMIDPKNLGKTETIGTIINKGFKVPAEYGIGERVYLPLNQQQHLFEYGGNSFCMIHYSYITVFMSDEYEVDLAIKSPTQGTFKTNLHNMKMVLGHTKGDLIRVYTQEGKELTREEIASWFNFQYENLK